MVTFCLFARHTKNAVISHLSGKLQKSIRVHFCKSACKKTNCAIDAWFIRIFEKKKSLNFTANDILATSADHLLT